MSEPLYVVVEIPKGVSNKYEWDEELGAIKLDRQLFSSLSYPTDYGFFRETHASDGDPLDAMVVVSEPTFPGCMIEVRPIALFKMRDEKAEDNKILCVPVTDPNWDHIDRLEDLPVQLRDEISHFFSIYKTPEWKVVKIDGWYSKEDALGSIARARGRWRELHGAAPEEAAGESEAEARQAATAHSRGATAADLTPGSGPAGANGRSEADGAAPLDAGGTPAVPPGGAS